MPPAFRIGVGFFAGSSPGFELNRWSLGLPLKRLWQACFSGVSNSLNGPHLPLDGGPLVAQCDKIRPGQYFCIVIGGFHEAAPMVFQ
jgi:hypothetical protein